MFAKSPPPLGLCQFVPPASVVGGAEFRTFGGGSDYVKASFRPVVFSSLAPVAAAAVAAVAAAAAAAVEFKKRGSSDVGRGGSDGNVGDGRAVAAALAAAAVAVAMAVAMAMAMATEQLRRWRPRSQQRYQHPNGRDNYSDDSSGVFAINSGSLLRTLLTPTTAAAVAAVASGGCGRGGTLVATGGAQSGALVSRPERHTRQLDRPAAVGGEGRGGGLDAC